MVPNMYNGMFMRVNCSILPTLRIKIVPHGNGNLSDFPPGYEWSSSQIKWAIASVIFFTFFEASGSLFNVPSRIRWLSAAGCLACKSKNLILPHWKKFSNKNYYVFNGNFRFPVMYYCYVLFFCSLCILIDGTSRGGT